MLQVRKSWSYETDFFSSKKKSDVNESYFVQENERKRKKRSEVGILIELEELIDRSQKAFKSVNREI